MVGILDTGRGSAVIVGVVIWSSIVNKLAVVRTGRRRQPGIGTCRSSVRNCRTISDVAISQVVVVDAARTVADIQVINDAAVQPNLVPGS